MALVLKDRVRETSTSTGTGTITLAGAVTGFQSFSAIGSGNTTFYTITMAGDWEVGIGTYTSPDQLSRDTVLESSNSNALVPFGAGTKDVFATFPAEGFASPPAIGSTTPNTITGTTITAYDDGVSNTGKFVLDSYNGSGWYTIIDPSGIYLDDGAGGYAAVNFPYGFTVPGVLSLNSVYIGVNLAIANIANLIFYTSSNAINIAAPTTSAPYTLTLPNSAGSNNQVLKTDGSGNLSWTNTLSGFQAAVTADPSAPSNGNVAVYGRAYGGYNTLAARNALNTPFGLQSALWAKNITMWTNTNSTGGSWLNSSGASSGTFAAVTPTTGSTLYQTIRRSTYANVITTANQVLGVNSSYLNFFRGSVAGQGGFFFYARCGFDVWTNGGRFFAGMALNNTTIISANPSALNNTVGFCVDSGDNGAISFLTRGTAATKASTGYTITSNKGYDLYFYCAPNSSQYTWEIVDINAGTSATGTATLNLPTNTQTQQPCVLASNAALTPATSISLGVSKIYCESDY